MTSDIEELQEILFRDQKNFFFKKKVVFNRNVFIWFSTLTNLPEFIKKEHKMMKK